MSEDTLDKRELYRWRTALEAELNRVENLADDHQIIQRTPKDPQKFRNFLSGENELFGSVLEKRILGFISKGTWGDLSGDQIFYLMLRLKLADLVLDAMIRDEACERGYLGRLPRPPSPDRTSEFWRWLLISVWGVLGEHYLVSWVDDCLRKYHAQRVDRT